MRDQIAFYKAHRRVFQYGRLIRHATQKDNKVFWQCVNSNAGVSVAGAFQTLAHAAEGNDALPLSGLSPDADYRLQTKPQRIFVRGSARSSSTFCLSTQTRTGRCCAGSTDCMR